MIDLAICFALFILYFIIVLLHEWDVTRRNHRDLEDYSRWVESQMKER